MVGCTKLHRRPEDSVVRLHVILATVIVVGLLSCFQTLVVQKKQISHHRIAVSGIVSQQDLNQKALCGYKQSNIKKLRPVLNTQYAHYNELEYLYSFSPL